MYILVKQLKAIYACPLLYIPLSCDMSMPISGSLRPWHLCIVTAMCHVYYYFLYWVHCNTQCSSLGSLVFTHWGSTRRITWLIDTIINFYYYYVFPPLQYHNTLFKCSLNCKSFLESSSSSILANLGVSLLLFYLESQSPLLFCPN